MALAHHSASISTPEPAGARRNEWHTVARVLPYLWEYRGRVLLALVFLVIAKLANVSVPLVLKEVVDALDTKQAASVHVSL